MERVMNRREFLAAITATVSAIPLVGSALANSAPVVSAPVATPMQITFGWLTGLDGYINCDWRGPLSRGATWSMTGHEYASAGGWYPEGGKFPDGKYGRLNELGRRMLFDKFQLAAVAEDLSLETLETMSPSALVLKRRALEAAHGLPRLEVMLGTADNRNINAELVA